MGLMPMKRLLCKVRFGYLDPSKIEDRSVPDGNFNTPEYHRNRLVESLKAEGVRNPLIVMAYRDTPPYVTVGHHRLWAAKQAGLGEVPAIINDWGNCFPEFEILSSLDEVRSKFKDQPNLVKSFRDGVSTSEPLINGDTWWKKD